MSMTEKELVAYAKAMKKRCIEEHDGLKEGGVWGCDCKCPFADTSLSLRYKDGKKHLHACKIGYPPTHWPIDDIEVKDDKQSDGQEEADESGRDDS